MVSDTCHTSLDALPFQDRRVSSLNAPSLDRQPQRAALRAQPSAGHRTPPLPARRRCPCLLARLVVFALLLNFKKPKNHHKTILPDFFKNTAGNSNIGDLAELGVPIIKRTGMSRNTIWKVEKGVRAYLHGGRGCCFSKRRINSAMHNAESMQSLCSGLLNDAEGISGP